MYKTEGIQKLDIKKVAGTNTSKGRALCIAYIGFISHLENKRGFFKFETNLSSTMNILRFDTWGSTIERKGEDKTRQKGRERREAEGIV